MHAIETTATTCDMGYSLAFHNIMYSAPVGAPVLLAIESTTSTSISLTWDPPPDDQLNGVLRQFVILVEEIDTGRNFTMTSTEPQMVVGNLHPFYTYIISVCAVTIDIGPCAYYDPVQLPQDGK